MIKNFKPDPEVGAVIVGFDKHFSFPKLSKAATYLQDPSVYFIGTNCDTERPSPNTNKFPGYKNIYYNSFVCFKYFLKGLNINFNYVGTGCFIKIIEAASNRSAVMLGKPESFLSEYIIKKYGLNPQRTLMIGDK